MQPLKNTTRLSDNLPENTTRQSKTINKLRFNILVILYIKGYDHASTLFS